MGMRPPHFAVGDGINAISEFREYARAEPLSGPHVLAELTRLHNLGSYAELSVADGNATKVSDLFCRRDGSWAVFYTATRIPFQITVVLVGDTAKRSFADLEAAAEQRLALLR